MTRTPWALTLSRLEAMGWLVLGRREAAVKVFDRMLVRWPANAYALASRAHLKAQLGRRDEAIADSRALVAAHPDRSAADWFNLAFLLEEALLLTEAECAFAAPCSRS